MYAKKARESNESWEQGVPTSGSAGVRARESIIARTICDSYRIP